MTSWISRIRDDHGSRWRWLQILCHKWTINTDSGNHGAPFVAGWHGQGEFQEAPPRLTCKCAKGQAMPPRGVPPAPLQSPTLARDGLPGGGGRGSPSDGLAGGGGGIARVFQGKLGNVR